MISTFSAAAVGSSMADDSLVSLPSKIVMKHSRCVLLEKENYYSWEAQFSAMLCGYELMPYVEGSVELSTPVARQQDQLILSWLLTGISPTILPQVVSFRTSAGVWQCLRKLYASSTQTCQLHLRLQLQTIRKGNLSMEDFISRIVVLKDSLAFTG